MIQKLLKKKKNPVDELLEVLNSSNFDEELARDLVYSGDVDINSVDSNGETFLHKCLKNKKLKSAMWLITNNIDINKTDNQNKTAFDIAVSQQNHRIVDTLLTVAQIDINKKDQFGRTLLQDSVVLGDHEMAKILLNHGIDINSKDNKNRNVLYDALSYGNERFIDYLLTFDNLDLNYVDLDQNSAMHHPLVKESKALAIKLIKHGADPTIKDKEGNTFLCETTLQGIENIDVIKAAIDEECDINSRVAKNNSILMELIYATAEVNEDDEYKRKSLLRMSRELINYGIDINALNDNNENALFRAIKIADDEQVSFLLSTGIHVNQQNNDGETPLSLACMGGIKNYNIVSLLLEHGANPLISNNDGKTLFEILNEIILHNHENKELFDKEILSKIDEEGQYIRILKLILDKNERELNFLDSTGRPIFFMPLLYNNIPLFKFYVKAKVNLHLLNKDGQNLFFEYVLKMFEEENKEADFQSALSMLISARINHNATDETGWTAVSKVIATTTCDFDLFKTLVKVVRFDYTVVDKLGRTAIHTAVWSSNAKVVKVINYIDSRIKNTPDNYGILPVIYSALLGDKRLVSLFIELKSNIRTDVTISHAAKKKFSSLTKNLEKLSRSIEDEKMMESMKKVIEQVESDFNVK